MKYRCRYCREKFELSELQSRVPQVCKSRECLKLYFDEYKERLIEKGEKKVKREMKESLKTHGQWLNDLQNVFNAYIRKRDEGLPCISCGKFAENYDASHYWSVGGYSGLRFDEMNVHKSCTLCNQHLHGNLAEYAPRLIEKIGQAEFDRLKSERNKELKLSIPEIRERIEFYKQKIREI